MTIAESGCAMENDGVSAVEAKLFMAVREALKDAYAAGVAAGESVAIDRARKELIAQLAALVPSSLSARSEATSHHIEPVEGAGERIRAPKGLPRELVKRALAANPEGLIPSDIEKYAETDYERMVKLTTIRSELRRGKEEGLYVERGGVWSLNDSLNSEGDPLL